MVSWGFFMTAANLLVSGLPLLHHWIASGRVEHPCSTAANQGCSALPKQKGA